MKPFVHLHSHTEYSLQDGISRLPQMVARAKELNMPALAITDQVTCVVPFIFIKKQKVRG